MKKTNTRYSLISLAAACLFGGLPHAVQADYYSAVTNLNPVAYYRLGETVMVPPGDVATNYGALGGVAYFRNGVTHGDAGALVGSADTAATFTSGSQQAAFYPYQTNLSQTNAFTVEAWLKPTALSGTMCALSHVGFVGPNVRNGWVLYQIASGANFIWSFRTYPGGNNINAVVTLNSSPISAGTWYHVAVVYQTNRVALVVDGVEAASANNPGPLAANYVLPFAIGARSENASWWGGTADEVAYYTNALSAAEIAAHYSNGTNPSPSPSYDTLIQAQNPLLYFRMNEPAWSAGTPVTAVNSGSLGAGADGSWNAGAVAGVSGPRPPEFAGFEANNTAGQFNHYYGNVSAPALLDNLTEYTISAWVRRQVLWISSLTIGAIAGQNAVCQFAWSTHQNDNGEVIGAYVWPGSTYGRQVKAAALPMYQWHHVAITVADGRVVIYENGVGAVTNTEAYSATIANGAAFGIGGGMITGQRDGFAGNIDEVAVFTSALSAAQIKALYEAAGPVPRVTSITRTPADPVFVGANITNTVVATGPGPITYQWRKDGTPVGAATNVFIVLNAQASDSGSYDVVLTNPNGSVTSRVDVLTIQASPPAIFTQPASVARCEGVSATFSVTAGGTEPLFYQWRKDATPIAGATASSYTINLVTAADAGNYDVV
ncbi:MAG: hypothetical protein NT154_13800, partial [Verrucomicrobia bacterium]|nr:hypothetical protein [Verrucomicrobiota bacterium]